MRTTKMQLGDLEEKLIVGVILSELKYSVKINWKNNVDLSSLRAARLFQRANAAAGMAIVQDVSDRFRNEGAPPAKWAPLQPATIRARTQGKKKKSNAHLPVAKILQDSGDLAKSIQKGDKNNVTEVDSLHVLVGTRLKYGAVHQFGYSDRNIPQRQYIYPPDEIPELKKDIDEIYNTILKDYIGAK